MQGVKRLKIKMEKYQWQKKNCVSVKDKIKRKLT